MNPEVLLSISVYLVCRYLCRSVHTIEYTIRGTADVRGILLLMSLCTVHTVMSVNDDDDNWWTPIHKIHYLICFILFVSAMRCTQSP